jgi:hypothetical protein
MKAGTIIIFASAGSRYQAKRFHLNKRHQAAAARILMHKGHILIVPYFSGKQGLDPDTEVIRYFKNRQ